MARESHCRRYDVRFITFQVEYLIFCLWLMHMCWSSCVWSLQSVAAVSLAIISHTSLPLTCAHQQVYSLNEFVMLKCNNKMYEKWTSFSSGSFACLRCTMLCFVSVCIAIMVNHFIVIYRLLLHANRLAVNTVADDLMLIFLHLHCFVANGFLTETRAHYATSEG